MKLIDTLLLAASAAFLFFAVHQGITFGLQHSYFFLMMSTGLFLWYSLRKKKLESEEDKKTKKAKSSVTKRKK